MATMVSRIIFRILFLLAFLEVFGGGVDGGIFLGPLRLLWVRIVTVFLNGFCSELYCLLAHLFTFRHLFSSLLTFGHQNPLGRLNLILHGFLSFFSILLLDSSCHVFDILGLLKLTWPHFDILLPLEASDHLLVVHGLQSRLFLCGHLLSLRGFLVC